MITLSKPQMDAAQAFANAAVSALHDGGKMHAGTVVAGSARMAGTYLFRSFGLELRGVKPGHAVLSEPADARGPVLIQIAAGILDRLGIKLDSAAGGALASSPQQPRREFLQTQMTLKPDFAPIKDRFASSKPEAAQAGAVATALLIRHCAKVLDPNTAFAIAALGFVEGTKTAPEPVHLVSSDG
jgi:hypothetical protein